MSISVKLIRRRTDVLLASKKGNEVRSYDSFNFRSAVVAMLQPVGHSRHVLLALAWPLTAWLI